MSRRPTLCFLLAAAALVCSLAATRADEPARATIDTMGESAISAKPDFAVITIGVQSADKAAQAALANNSKATAAVIEALKSVGVEPKDIQTADFSIWPQTANAAKNGGESTAIVGYVVSNRVKATLRDLPRLGDALDKTVAAGANAINGVQFGVANASLLLDEARKAAFVDARRKAELYAAEAGVKLSGLASLDETSGSTPVFAVAAGMAMAKTPIEAGESRLSVSIRARFDIAPREASKP